MIYKNPDIILPETLSLLRRIQQDEFFDDFFLVGGTALALQIDHRLSIGSEKPAAQAIFQRLE